MVNVLFRLLSNHVFWTPKFPKYISYDSHFFFSKRSKFNLDFENAKKKKKKKKKKLGKQFFSLSDNIV